MNKVIRTFEVSAELDAAIKRLAKGTARTPSQIVSEAVEQLLADQDDLSVELERWAEYERTGESIDLDDAAKTLKAKLEARLKAPARRRRTASK
jgi:predicted transcriptional regulator